VTLFDRAAAQLQLASLDALAVDDPLVIDAAEWLGCRDIVGSGPSVCPEQTEIHVDRLERLDAEHPAVGRRRQERPAAVVEPEHLERAGDGIER
jgi:hypothetical protein